MWSTDTQLAPAPPGSLVAGASRGRLSLAGDERLARLISDGNEQAFAALYERYHQRLYRYCRSMLHNDADAQDALQSAFAGAFSALAAGRRDAPMRPWLYRIAYNESVSVLRRRRPEVTLGAAHDRPTASAAEQAEERARLQLLMSDLAELTERQRGALVMRELSGLSHEEIAQAFGISAGAAKQTIFEARGSLAEFAQGRAMACEDVCRAVSDGNGRVLRGRRLRAHLRDCSSCAAFAAAIPARSRDLHAIAPPLSAVAATSLLRRALGTSSRHGSGAGTGTSAGTGTGAGAGTSAGAGTAAGGTGTGASTGVTVVAGAAGKAATIAVAAKAIAGVAVIATAAVGVSGVVKSISAPGSTARAAPPSTTAGARRKAAVATGVARVHAAPGATPVRLASGQRSSASRPVGHGTGRPADAQPRAQAQATQAGHATGHGGTPVTHAEQPTTAAKVHVKATATTQSHSQSPSRSQGESQSQTQSQSQSKSPSQSKATSKSQGQSQSKGSTAGGPATTTPTSSTATPTSSTATPTSSSAGATNASSVTRSQPATATANGHVASNGH